MQEDNAKKVTKKKSAEKQKQQPNVKKNTTKPKVSTITMTGKPSCRSCCRRAYKWHIKTYKNYCPNCKRTNVLRKNPKGVPEKELTCSRCDCDYCVVCGHDKSGGRRHYYNILHTP